MPKTKTVRHPAGQRNQLAVDPLAAATVTLKAAALVEQGELDAAEVLYRQAIRMSPHLAGAWLGLGLVYMQQREYKEAFRHLARAMAEAEKHLQHVPDDRPSWVARCMASGVLYRPVEAVESARRALAMAPDMKIHSNMLFMMNFLPETTPEELHAETCRWSALYAPSPDEFRPHPNVPDPDRRLKIGYVSADLYDHAVMRFLPQLFEMHDRSRYSATAYYVGKIEDACTQQIRQAVENFVHCPESGDALEERIRADQIDILVDLAGHTMPLEAFTVFSRKPAPVQISWLGLLATTGFPAIDYYVGDGEVPCPGTEHCFSERVYRLPRSVACYRPALEVPVAPSPCLKRGYITFGSFNNPAKIGHHVVKVWAEIMRSVPGSRIMLKYRTMDTEVMRDRYQGWFSKEKISRERVLLFGPNRAMEYLQSYGEIDIALDPFPYQGGSTTLDLFWMGVPLVAMAGRKAVQCSTSSILKAVGMTDMVVNSPEEYIKAGVFLAGIVGKIPEIRQNIRKAFQASPFMDERGFTRDLEAAYRDMWRSWCRKQAARGTAPAGG